MSMTMSMSTLELPDGTVIEPSGDSFEITFSTMARWRDDAALSQQIGLA